MFVMKVVNFFVLRMDVGKHVHSTRSTAVQRDPRQTHPAEIRYARPVPVPISHHTSVVPPTNSERQHRLLMERLDLLSRLDVHNVVVPGSRDRLLFGKRLF